MPIYNYGCEACDHRFSIHAKMSDPPKVECPKCSKPALKKLVSRTGFRLKGGGWYEQGYAGGKTNTATSSDDS